MRLIQDLSSDEQTVDVDGQEFPVPSVVEDDETMRYLLVEDEHLMVSVWKDAHRLGVIALALVDEDPSGKPRIHVQSAETFEVTRDELGEHRFLIDISEWQEIPGPLLMTAIVPYLPDPAAEPDRPPARFVSLHTHSEYSALDGYSRLGELVKLATADGQPALAITDHGTNAGQPEQQALCEAAGIKPIFGIEAYFVEDRKRRPRKWTETVTEEALDDVKIQKTKKTKEVIRTDADEVKQYAHICLWAANDIGLRNLWAASTEAYVTGRYYHPRMDWEVLERCSEGVFASTGCLHGPLALAILDDDDARARQYLARMQQIFGDRLLIEIHTNSLPEQEAVNIASVMYAREMGIRMFASVDSHYSEECDAEMHAVWMAMQTNKDITEDTGMFGGEDSYFLHTADQVQDALAYLGEEVVDETMATTVWVAEQCTARIAGEPAPPTFSKGPDAIEDDVRRLRDLCEANWERKVIGKNDPEQTYRDRFEREMGLLEAKQFCGYFMIVADYVRAAKQAGILVGPGRGSGGGSLVAYLADIVEIDPVFYDLMFERFMTEGRVSLPDFDIDFPASKRDWIKNYLREKWGHDNVVTIGTVLRLQCKGAINDAFRVLKSTLEGESYWVDQKVAIAVIDAANAPLAGKQIAWDELWEQFGAVLDPIRKKYPKVFQVADAAVGRLKSYGKHAAGVVVSTDKPLTDLPLRVAEDGQMVTQFDMAALEALGYVKFDLLTLRTLDTVQESIDLIQTRYGQRIDVYDWREELEDPLVWSEVAAGNTLGMFQVETKAGTKLTRRLKPASVDDLAVVMTIVRPGPMRSGLTETYLRRRAGEEPVSVLDPRLKPSLAPTLGAMIYQEQVMAACMELAGYDSTKADDVRKILGKKLVEKVEAAGEEFIRRAVENDTDSKIATVLWNQMAEFAKYGFGKAHAVGYAVLGYWTAWLKFHFSVEFLTAALSTVDADRIPEFVNETRRMGYEIMPPDINASQNSFSAEHGIIRYGISAIKGIGADTARQILESKPYSSIQDFQDRLLIKGSKVNAGHLKALVAIGAFDTLHPNRRGLEQMIEFQTSGDAETCVHKDLSVKAVNNLPCTFDWAHESNPPTKKVRKRDCHCVGDLAPVPNCPDCGGSGVITHEVKPPPKRCSIACRNYTKPDPLDHEQVPPYTRDDIIAREHELLGVYLTGSPFERIPEELREGLYLASEVDRGAPGEYIVGAMIEGVRPSKTKYDDDYAWVVLNAQDGTLDCTCWSRAWNRYRKDIHPGSLVVAVLNKNDRGVELKEIYPT